MTVPLESLSWMRLASGPDTQPEHLPYAGQIIGVPPGTDVGSGPTNPGIILGVRGYPEQRPPGSVPPIDWVMTSSLPTVARDYIHAIPDTGWVRPESEATFQAMARALIEFPVPMASVGDLLTQLWTAAVLNERAVP